MAVEAYFGSARSSGTTWAARHGRLHLPRPLSAFADRLLLPVIACFVWRKYTIRRGNCQVKRTARCAAFQAVEKAFGFFRQPERMSLFCAALRHENSRFAPRTPCKARLCATFDPIRGGLCLLELPLRKRTADPMERVYRQAEGGAMRRPLSLLCSYRLLDLIQMPCFWALAMSSSRNMGWAMEMSFSARSQVEQPTRFTPPYSVTM